MADEGDNLHDPWAPPPEVTTEGPVPTDADVPTRVTPLESPIDELGTPLPPFEPVTIPDPVPASPPSHKWPRSAKAIVVLLAFLLLATAAGLGYGPYTTNEDEKDLENASNQQGQELSGQLDKSHPALASTQQQLTAANAKVTDLQNQLTTTQSQLADAQKQADTAKAESAALAALFPMNAQKLQPAMP